MFAYSDVPYEYVMHKAALVNALGADFRLMGLDATQLKSSKPVVSVRRTHWLGQARHRRVAKILINLGYRVAAVQRTPCLTVTW